MRGFTLLELLLSMALTTVLIILASNVYNSIQQVGGRSVNMQRNWGAQQFLRQQVDAADFKLNKFFSAVKGESALFSFVSRNSAQFGQNQRPVLVTYWYNGTGSLKYTEITLPPWWGEDASLYASQIDGWRMDQSSATYRNNLFTGVNQVSFEYWDANDKRWLNKWSNKNAMPSLIRLTLDNGGQSQEIVLAPGVLSLSSAYGY